VSYSYEYPRPALSVDLVIFRKVKTGREVLLIQRRNEPYAEKWALPGGFLDMDETLESAAARELKEETGLVVESLKQLKAYSTVDRDPRGRVISVAFLTVLQPDQIPVAADDAKDVAWYDLDSLPELAFDHAEIVGDAKGLDS
jgi:8-oxo-dGTP diphosphatase